MPHWIQHRCVITGGHRKLNLRSTQKPYISPYHMSYLNKYLVLIINSRINMFPRNINSIVVLIKKCSRNCPRDVQDRRMDGGAHASPRLNPSSMISGRDRLIAVTGTKEDTALIQLPLSPYCLRIICICIPRGDDGQSTERLKGADNRNYPAPHI